MSTLSISTRQSGSQNARNTGSELGVDKHDAPKCTMASALACRAATSSAQHLLNVVSASTKNDVVDEDDAVVDGDDDVVVGVDCNEKVDGYNEEAEWAERRDSSEKEAGRSASDSCRATRRCWLQKRRTAAISSESIHQSNSIDQSNEL